MAYKQKSLPGGFYTEKETPPKVLHISSGMGFIAFFMSTWVLLGVGKCLYMYMLDVWYSQISHHDCHSIVYVCPNTIQQWSPTLLLESFHPADFSSNPASAHLSVVIKQPWTPLLAGSGEFDWGWIWNLQDGSSPGAGLETTAIQY